MKQFVKFSFIILALLDCPDLRQVENWDSSSLPFSGSWNGEASCPSRRFHQYYQSSAKKTFLASLPSSCFSSFWDRQAHCPTVSFHQCQSWESLDAIGWVVRGRLFNKEKILLQWCVMCRFSIFDFRCLRVCRVLFSFGILKGISGVIVQEKWPNSGENHNTRSSRFLF